MNSPIMFQDGMIADFHNIKPWQVKGRANIAVENEKRFLYSKLYSVYKFKLPKWWALNFFRFWLFRWGSIGMVYTNEFGWIAQPYSIVALDYQYNPKEILVYNSHISRPVYGLVGYNAVIIHLMDDYFGLDDLVTKYAETLAQVWRSTNVNLMNSNFTLKAEVSTKKEAQEIGEAYSQASSGKPLVLLNKDVMNGREMGQMIPNLRNNFISPDLMEVRRAIVNAFLTEIGIRNVSVQKKERLTSTEGSENNDETSAIANIIFENLSTDFEVARNISGLDMNVELRYNYEDVSRETSKEVRSGD